MSDILIKWGLGLSLMMMGSIGIARETNTRQVDNTHLTAPQPKVKAKTTSNQLNAMGNDSNINKGSGSAQKKDFLAMGMNTAAGGMFMMMGKAAMAASPARTTEAAMYFSMGALTFAQAGMDGAAGSGAGKTNQASLWDGTNANYKNEGLDQNTLNNMNELKKMGYDYDSQSGKLKTPFGEFSPSDFNSVEAGEKAGLSAEMLSGLKTALEKAGEIEKKLENMTAQKKEDLKNNGELYPSTEGGGGGGSGGSSSASSNYNYDIFSGKKSRTPASLDGMKKILNGDVPVGISVDNIFEMVRRKYHQQEDRNRFF